MSQPPSFDAFYHDARTRLLLQTYALTGDLPAARSAVRDSFIVTWHHWRKVSRLPDPEAWVRPHAWAQAQRRHTARIWHRDKSLGPEAKATFEALGKLTLAQRRALVLDRFTSLSLADRARELGVTAAAAERQTESATVKFLEHRGIGAERLDGLCEQLEALVQDSSLPRASILRRAGNARRRTHTLVGAVAAVAAVFVTGSVVSGSTLEGQPVEADSGPAPSSPSSEPEPADPVAAFTADRLLTADAMGLLVEGRGWREDATTDNSRGNGRVAPCQQDRYADPAGISTLVRTFDTSPKRAEPAVSAVQYAELSRTTRASHRAYRRMVSWYAGCVTPRTQLMHTYSVAGAGDEAQLFHLHSWRSPASAYVVGVARTGRIVTTTLTRTSAPGAPGLRDSARFLGGAINGLCTTTPRARCAADPQVKEIAPLRVGDTPSLLLEADLPPVTRVSQPWVGTEPRQARTNAAATRCDNTDFSQQGISNARTRTFLVPGADVSPAFGITETVASMPTDRAKTFVTTVRDRVASCPDRDAGTDVRQLASSSGGDRDISLWRVSAELSDDESVTYLMGIVRVGTAVAQIGFVPTPEVVMEPGAFEALARRAMARLAFQPAPKR
ncbi:MAG: hypothetical protein ACXWDL_05295 [Nocardioides sp.]